MSKKGKNQHIQQPCHVGPAHVFDIGKVRIWAGKRLEVMEHQDLWDLMVSCAGDGASFRPETPVVADEMAQAILPERLFNVSPPPFVAIDWPDGGTPALGPDWWLGLISWFKEQDHTKDVCFYCFGGHGRTGTALATLMGLEYPKINPNPIASIRKLYCADTMETLDQIEYVERITDIPTTEVPSRQYGGYGYAGTVVGNAGSNSKVGDIAVGHHKSDGGMDDPDDIGIVWNPQTGTEHIRIGKNWYDPEDMTKEQLTSLGFAWGADGWLVDLYEEGYPDATGYDPGESQDYQGKGSAKL